MFSNNFALLDDDFTLVEKKQSNKTKIKQKKQKNKEPKTIKPRKQPLEENKTWEKDVFKCDLKAYTKFMINKYCLNANHTYSFEQIKWMTQDRAQYKRWAMDKPMKYDEENKCATYTIRVYSAPMDIIYNELYTDRQLKKFYYRLIFRGQLETIDNKYNIFIPQSIHYENRLQNVFETITTFNYENKQ